MSHLSTVFSGGPSYTVAVSFAAHVHRYQLSFVGCCANSTSLRFQISHSAVSETELASASAVNGKREEAIDDRVCDDLYYLECLSIRSR